MVAKRPSIMIYINSVNEKILREICAGIEEEGIFFEICDQENEKIDELAYQAANASALGVGIAAEAENILLTFRGLESGKYIEYYEHATLEDARKAGINSARVVKKVPLK